MKTLRIILVALIAFFALTLFGCSNSSDSGNEVTGGGITEPSKNDKTEDKLSTECELKDFGLYVKVDTSLNQYQTLGFALFEGIISENIVNISLPSDFKNSAYYLCGTISDKAKFNFDGTEKKLNLYDGTWPTKQTEEYQIAFEDGKTSYEIDVTAEDGKTKKTYTVSVEWSATGITITYDLNGATGTAPTTDRKYYKGEKISVKNIDYSVSKKTDGNADSVFLGWTDENGKKYKGYDDITIDTTDITLTAKWSKYGIGEKITATAANPIKDIFGNSIGNDVGDYDCIVAYIRTSDSYSTKFVDKDSKSQKISYSVVDADGKDWLYLVSYTKIFDGGPWSDNTTIQVNYGDDTLNIGAGKTNSDKIRTSLITSNLAEGLYSDYKLYLPSAGEMHAILDALAKKTGDLSSNIFWTSTESNYANVFAYCWPNKYTNALLTVAPKTTNDNNIAAIGVTYLPEED